MFTRSLDKNIGMFAGLLLPFLLVLLVLPTQVGNNHWQYFYRRSFPI
jgi:hypothetical protein